MKMGEMHLNFIILYAVTLPIFVKPQSNSFIYLEICGFIVLHLAILCRALYINYLQFHSNLRQIYVHLS